MKALFSLSLIALLAMPLSAKPKSKAPVPVQVEQWGMYEVSFSAPVPADTNPFDVQFSATFCGADTLTVAGFYDGDTRWKVRFMPRQQGTWNYVTTSSIEALNQQKGSFQCIAPSADNHGPVQVDSTGLNFCYADGKQYYPIGTTSYDWMHASSDPSVSSADPGLTMQQQTLKSLSKTGFT